MISSLSVKDSDSLAVLKNALFDSAEINITDTQPVEPTAEDIKPDAPTEHEDAGKEKPRSRKRTRGPGE